MCAMMPKSTFLAFKKLKIWWKETSLVLTLWKMNALYSEHGKKKNLLKKNLRATEELSNVQTEWIA